MDPFITIFDEKVLLHCLHQSDQNAFTKIYNQYGKKLFFPAAYKLHNVIEKLTIRKMQHNYQQSTSQQTYRLGSSTNPAFHFETLQKQSLEETAKLPNQCCLNFQINKEETYSHKFSNS